MKKFFATFFSMLLNSMIIIAVIVLIVLTYSFLQIKIEGKKYVNIFGYSAFQVASGSMLNTIHVGDIIIAKIDNEFDHFAIDDIIVFNQEDNIITHRIIDIKGNQIITKGDANNTADQPITIDAVIGKVIKIIPNIAIWKKVFTSPEVVILIILTVNLWGIGISLTSRDKEKNEKEILKKKDKEDV